MSILFKNWLMFYIRDESFLWMSQGVFGIKVKKEFPDTRVVHEELPFQVANNGDVGGGVEVVAQDSLEEQNIKGKLCFTTAASKSSYSSCSKGARVYDLRHVFHDFSDDRCVAIFRRLADAMEVS